MKESIQKIAGTAKEVAELLKAGKTEDAIAKLSEVAEQAEAAAAEAGASEASATEQAEEIAKTKLEIKKWADLFVTADSLEAVLSDIREAVAGFSPLPDLIAKLEGRVETVEKASAGSKQITKEEVPSDAAPLEKLAARFAK